MKHTWKLIKVSEPRTHRCPVCGCVRTRQVGQHNQHAYNVKGAIKTTVPKCQK